MLQPTRLCDCLQHDALQAESLYVEALAGRRAELGNEHPDTLTSINNLASLLQNTDREDEAAALLFEAADTAKKVLGPDHPHTKIFSANALKLQARTRAQRDVIYTKPTGEDDAKPRPKIGENARDNLTSRKPGTARKAGIGRVHRPATAR